MSEINVLRGRKFEDCFEEYTTNDSSSPRGINDLVLERLYALELPLANVNRVVVLANIIDPEVLHGANWGLKFVEACDLIVRKLFDKSLFESTQADIEAEAELRDAENEYAKLAASSDAAYNRLFVLKQQYEERVEDVTA